MIASVCCVSDKIITLKIECQFSRQLSNNTGLVPGKMKYTGGICQLVNSILELSLYLYKYTWCTRAYEHSSVAIHVCSDSDITVVS